ncbi:MAG: serine/threonine protein kinase, partial [Verrucomicrobiaceae bacterium]
MLKLEPERQMPSIEKLLFTAASGFVEAADRRAFLDFVCKDDPAKLKQLEELLAIQKDAEEFFELQPEVVNASDAGMAGDGEAGLGASIGPYRLIDRLGSGGCGVVYLAEQQVPVKRRVALKIIRFGMDTDNVIVRFSLEREALALMDHPNIARVLDAGVTTSGLPYFVMELVDGERITDFCDHNRLGLRQRLELFILVCEAIQHAHQKGVIHRDIKPSNVLVRGHDGKSVPKVIDFGIAKATAGNLDSDGTVTNFGQFIGTPAYMSPEQAEGGLDIDTRTDIYSLGILLYELLTGKPPLNPEYFKDRGIEEIRGMLREGQTSLPSARLRSIPVEEISRIAGNRNLDPQRLPSLVAGDLDWIVMKAIEPERHRRYETANGLAMDVQRYLSEQPVLARPPSRRYLLTKLVRRNRVTFAAASIALFGLLGGLGASTWLFLRERHARHEQARLS